MLFLFVNVFKKALLAACSLAYQCCLGEGKKHQASYIRTDRSKKWPLNAVKTAHHQPPCIYLTKREVSQFSIVRAICNMQNPPRKCGSLKTARQWNRRACSLYRWGNLTLVHTAPLANNPGEKKQCLMYACDGAYPKSYMWYHINTQAKILKYAESAPYTLAIIKSTCHS